jgi:hypothetical protein
MSELYFSYGRGESFTSIKLANKKTGYANPIRELMQNSLDASREAENDKCIINIYIEKIKKTDIPNISDYKVALDKAISSLELIEGYSSNNKQIVKSISNELTNEYIDILMFVDNGTGMRKEKLENLLDEISSHADEGAGGSYGVGHLSSYFLSSLRYVLYATKFRDQNKNIINLFTGSTILAGHKSNNAQRGSKGRVIKNIPTNEANPEFEYLEEFPDFIQSKMDKLNSTGSMVAILGLTEKWDSDAEYAIASNFFHAISDKKLEVSIHKNGMSTKIDNNKLAELLFAKKDKKNATNAILSGIDFYQAYQTIENVHKIIRLDSGEKVYIYVSNKIDSSSCICLVRNGMLIARHDKMLSRHIENLRKNEDYENFMIVIDIDKSEAKEFFRLIRNAENTEHNKLIKKTEASNEDKKNINNRFEELSKKIVKFLNKKNREGFDLAMPLLEIPNKAEAQGSNTSRPRSQTSKAKPNTNKPKPPINKIKTTNNGKKSEFKPIISRYLEAKNSMRMKDKGGTIDIELNITPQKIEAKDEVYLSISLAQDKDNDEGGNALDFVSLSIDGVGIEIPGFVEVEQEDGNIEKQEADRSQIKLGILSETQTYSIEATIKKPKNIKDISIALRPFLGLKQRGK